MHTLGEGSGPALFLGPVAWTRGCAVNQQVPATLLFLPTAAVMSHAQLCTWTLESWLRSSCLDSKSFYPMNHLTCPTQFWLLSFPKRYAQSQVASWTCTLLVLHGGRILVFTRTLLGNRKKKDYLLAPSQVNIILTSKTSKPIKQGVTEIADQSFSWMWTLGFWKI